MSARADLRDLIGSYRIVQALHVAVALGIPELLADGGRTSDELATAADADPQALYRLLRALARVGILTESDGRRFELTEAGSELRADEVRTRLLFVGRPSHWNTWSHLLHSVRTGENAFESLHGETVWAYRARHPEESAVFDAWQNAATSESHAAIVSAYDFGRFAHVVDVGGGRGAFLTAILRANPGTRGTLFDQAHVVAEVTPVERCDVVAGSFFDSVPPGGDAYVLKSVIHDWRDAEATAILRTVASALQGEARVLLVERDLAHPDSAWLDLQMLLMPGGQERTEQEYAALFRAAGLEHVGLTPVGGGWAVVEARA